MKTKKDIKDIKNKQLDYLMKRGIKNDKGQLENIKNANDLAIKILENEKCREILKISDSDMDTKIDINGNIRYEKTLGNTAKSINNHLHYPDSMSQKYIKAYCIIFDCSADYLLGFIDLPTHENQSVYEITGLDNSTIDELSNLPISEKHIIDAMFGRTSGSMTLIKTIKEMLYYSHPITKNKTYIKLDRGLTTRDKDYEELEHELNNHDVIDIFSYKLSIEMRSIIEVLSMNKELSEEIYQDYKNKFFHKHKKMMSIDELPKIDSNGNFVFPDEIYRMEEKILTRLENRDKKGKIFNYGIDKLRNYSDFIELMRIYRDEKTEEDYLSWLKFIDDKTE